MTPRILIVEDDAQYSRWLGLHLETIWPDSRPVWHTHAQLDSVMPTLGDGAHDVLILCASFTIDGNGLCSGYERLRKLRRHAPELMVVAIATDGNELSAIKALRLGASDYLPRAMLTRQLLEEHLQSVLRRQRSKQAKSRHAGKRARSGARNPRRRWPDRPNTAVRPTIPRYTLLRQLADSSRAEVWLANSDALQKVVALKISKVEPGDAEDTALFAREYAAIAAISHPGVVDIFDYGVHNGHEFLAMEYFPAGDLKQRLQKPISESECLVYLQRIASALQPVHMAGMMHLDLKPPNIMLREDGSVVLIDFGLVKRMGSIASSTMMGVRRGSPYYMSPEQVHGLPLDPRSDIYSLGVVFYEMLTGRRPFVGTSAIELMDSHVKGQRPELPSGLAAYEPLLDSMMATNREQRLADAGALLELLQSPAYNPYTQEEIEAPAVAHA